VSSQSFRVAQISATALRANIERVVHESRPVDISGNAYGHGAVEVARFAADCGAQLWASNSDEVDWLRARGLQSSVLTGNLGAAPARDEIYGFVGGSVPVMTLRGRVVLTKPITAGEGVSYGYTFRAPSDGRTALVSLGYGDGIHRHAGNLNSLQVGSVRYPIVGRVAMNVCVLFLGTDSVDIGSDAVVFGDTTAGHPALSDWAARLGEPQLAVTSGITDRVERVLS
jgi:alanine racemase